MITALDAVGAENCVWFFDFECENFTQSGKKIYYKANDLTQGNFIQKVVSSFDSRYEQSDLYSGSQIVETNSSIVTNYATYMYSMNACTVIWSDSGTTQSEFKSATKKLAEFMGSFILEAVREPVVATSADLKPQTKQVVWKGNTTNNYLTLSSGCEPMWVSCYKQKLYGVYNVTLNGFVTVDSDYETIIRVRPILYQKNSPTDDYDSRSSNNIFDIEMNIPEGVSVIPFSSVLSCKYANPYASSANAEVGAVIAAACPDDVKVTSISYTINAIPSDARNSVEVLTPPGWATDYTDSDTTPVFNVIYPKMYYDVI